MSKTAVKRFQLFQTRSFSYSLLKRFSVLFHIIMCES